VQGLYDSYVFQLGFAAKGVDIVGWHEFIDLGDPEISFLSKTHSHGVLLNEKKPHFLIGICGSRFLIFFFVFIFLYVTEETNQSQFV
jgi:hypothetical protein